MKKNIILSSAFTVMMCVFGMLTANAQSEEIEIKEYCTIEEIQNGEAIYGRGIGESRNQQQARYKARSASIKELGENIEMNLKAFAKEFNSSTTVNDDEDYINIAKDLSQRIVNQNIANLKTACEKGTTYTNAKNIKVYKYYVIVEYDKVQLEEAVFDGLKEAGILKADYEYHQFQQEFDKVFEAESGKE